MTSQSDSASEPLQVQLRPRYNEQGDEMLWLLSWLVDDAGTEGEWFYSGTGGNPGEFAPPTEALGVRVRRWPSEGMDPEYVDLMLPEVRNLVLVDRGLAFDRPQRNSALRRH